MTRTGERNTPLYTTAMLRRHTRLRLAAAVAIAGALCQPILRAQPPATPVPATVSITADPDRLAVIRGATDDATARYAEWLGPAPFDRIEIVEGPGPSAANSRVLAIAVNLPLLAPAPLMALESQVAYGAAFGWLGGLRTRDDAVPLDQGLAWYLQSRIVERLFNLRVGATAYSSDEVALFGGAIRWPLPSLRLSRWSAGLGRDVFLRSRHHRVAPQVAEVADRHGAQAVRAALAFGTLERWLGWPTLQGALASLVQQSQGRNLSAKDAVAVLNASIGQDLSWFFDEVLDPARTFDYVLDGVNVQTMADGFRTEVVAVRRGAAQFTGTSKRPLGEYESGDALEVRIDFEDGQNVSAHWDGRADVAPSCSKVRCGRSVCRSIPTACCCSTSDPLNASRNLSQQTNAPIVKWIARWAVWLQDAALAYTSLL